MDLDRWRRSDEWHAESLAEMRRRLEEVPMAQRLLETIAWSAVLLADDLRRGVERPERALPPGLGPRAS